MKTIPKQYLGAFKRGHRKSVHEYIDDEFSYKLLERIEKNPNDKEAVEALTYITKYNNEVYRKVIKKNDPTALHNTPELYKKCTSDSNARDRDITSLAKGFNPKTPFRLVEFKPELFDPQGNED